MKKGDRIRCKRACGELPKGAEGICEKEPSPTGGLGLFAKGAYGIGHSDWDVYFEVIPDNSLANFSALEVQQGGTHYKDLKIQPIEYIHANNIPFAEGCAIKYLTRWRSKGGIEDLKKAKHFIELLIELEGKNAGSA